MCLVFSRSGYRYNPPPADGKKVILTDTDHLWGEGGNPGWVWKSFTRGLHPIWMERVQTGPGDLPQAEDIRRAMAHTLRLAERLNLATMIPYGELASSGYCLADPANAYVIYLPQGGEVTVDLSAATGELAVQWIHPIEGKTTPAKTCRLNKPVLKRSAECFRCSTGLHGSTAFSSESVSHSSRLAASSRSVISPRGRASDTARRRSSMVVGLALATSSTARSGRQTANPRSRVHSAASTVPRWRTRPLGTGLFRRKYS